MLHFWLDPLHLSAHSIFVNHLSSGLNRKKSSVTRITSPFKNTVMRYRSALKLKSLPTVPVSILRSLLRSYAIFRP